MTATENAPRGCENITTFAVTDFGATGDGVTDDYAAIHAALEAARACPGKTVVQFAPSAVYRLCAPEGVRTGIELFHFTDLTLLGDNTTLVFERLFTYIDIQYSRRIRIQGFNLKLWRPPYTVAEFLEADYAARTALIRTRDPLGITGHWRSPTDANFGLPMIDEARLHMFFRDIDVVDAEKHLYRLHFTAGGDMIDDRLHMVMERGCGFLTPMPEVGQRNVNAFLTTHTEDLTLWDVNLWSASYFNFHMRYNTGEFLLHHVCLTPEPGQPGEMVAWRDGFHIKDNRAHFTWEDCVIEKIFDDAFNLSCSLMRVNKVYSPYEFNLWCVDLNGHYPPALLPGDELLLTNERTGALLGRIPIAEVLRQDGEGTRVRVDVPLPLDMENDVYAACTTLAQPGATIRRCRVDGSFRFRGCVRIYDSDFTVTHAWLENEPIFEGPVPKDQLYRNCTFRGAKPGMKFFSFGAVSLSGVKPELKCENVVFQDCDVRPEDFFIRPGNELKLVRDGQVYFETK